jgi:pilus assembly protein CpaE
MKDVQRVAIVDPSDATREPLRNLLLGLDSVWLEAECARYEFFPDVVQQSRPDLALIALDADPNRGLQLIQQLAHESPYMATLAVSSRTDGPFILQTLRSGAKEFLTQPLVLEELLSAMQRVRVPQGGASGSPAGGSRGESQVIAVCGSRGGIGCTTIAVNLGCALAQEANHNAVLIDLDLALGDSDVSLDILPSYTLADVALNIDRLDMTFLRGSLSKHATGLSLLPHPVQLEDSGMIQEEHLRRVIGLLRAAYSHVILDLSKSFGPTDYAALNLADVILLVAQLELTSLRNVVRLLMSLGNTEGLAEKVHVVLNRVGSTEQEISLRKAEETIGKPIFWEIPNDSKTVLAARNAGAPLVQFAPRTKVCQSMQGLAQALAPQAADEPAEVPKKKGFRLFQ